MSLAGLLVIIVVLGGLAATAVIGANALSKSDNASVGPGRTGAGGRTNSGEARVGSGAGVAAAAAAACNAAAAAATTAGSVYFANSGGRAYPTRWSDLTASSPTAFALPARVLIDPKNPEALDGNGWTLLMSGGGATAPSFGCKAARP
jgi:hypothetical protein